jgi:hypothetical protein
MNSDPKYLITFDVEEWWSVHSFQITSLITQQKNMRIEL